MIKSVSQSFSSDFDLAAVKAKYEDQISAESADKAVVLSRGKGDLLFRGKREREGEKATRPRPFRIRKRGERDLGVITLEERRHLSLSLSILQRGSKVVARKHAACKRLI